MNHGTAATNCSLVSCEFRAMATNYWGTDYKYLACHRLIKETRTTPSHRLSWTPKPFASNQALILTFQIHSHGCWVVTPLTAHHFDEIIPAVINVAQWNFVYVTNSRVPARSASNGIRMFMTMFTTARRRSLPCDTSIQSLRYISNTLPSTTRSSELYFPSCVSFLFKCPEKWLSGKRWDDGRA